MYTEHLSYQKRQKAAQELSYTVPNITWNMSHDCEKVNPSKLGGKLKQVNKVF